MAACEECWAAASWKARLSGGHTADWYRRELEVHPNGHEGGE